MKHLTALIIGLGLFVAGWTDTTPPASGLGGECGDARKIRRNPVVGLCESENRIGSVQSTHAFSCQAAKTPQPALTAKDLYAAQTPAYWLSAHETIVGAPRSWQKHVKTMREAAAAMNDAKYLEAAAVAAQRITAGCKGCHAEAGVNVSSPEME